jgi:hypothetical protein
MLQIHKSLHGILAITALGSFLSACGTTKPTSNTPSSSENTAASTPRPSPLTSFERDLEDLKKGQFSYIWVFSRKDGKPLDKDDSTFLRTNAPQVVDWFITDEGKKVLAGTNFNLEEGNLETLKKRFNAEDYTGR